MNTVYQLYFAEYLEVLKQEIIAEKLKMLNLAKIRIWGCPNCGAVHDRDINASKNLLKLAM